MACWEFGCNQATRWSGKLALPVNQRGRFLSLAAKRINGRTALHIQRNDVNSDGSANVLIVLPLLNRVADSSADWIFWTTTPFVTGFCDQFVQTSSIPTLRWQARSDLNSVENVGVCWSAEWGDQFVMETVSHGLRLSWDNSGSGSQTIFKRLIESMPSRIRQVIKLSCQVIKYSCL